VSEPGRYPRRLIEVDLPIKRISAQARREKSIRHGHISTLHIWWARRPLAACRAVICAALWPDPNDELCPDSFLTAARELIGRWAAKHLDRCSAASFPRFSRIQQRPELLQDGAVLRAALLDFIADFANWNNSTVKEYLDTSRAFTQAAHHALGGTPGTSPLVIDPFAGGGAIPVEALRVGAECLASDINPVAVLLNRALVETAPRYGSRLPEVYRRAAQRVSDSIRNDLMRLYPQAGPAETPLVYLWARTIRCEGPG
jgi:adenine-specific DNA methylase